MQIRRNRSIALPPARGRRGYAGMIMLLIVVVIVMILLLQGPLSKDSKTQATAAQGYVERGREAACQVNRQAVATNLVMWQTTHGGETPSPAVLSRLVSGTTCPDGGIYYLGKDGTIYCTLHKPPPPDEIKNLIRLVEPTPTPTPESSNTLPPDLLTPTLESTATIHTKATPRPEVSTAPGATPIAR